MIEIKRNKNNQGSGKMELKKVTMKMKRDVKEDDNVVAIMRNRRFYIADENDNLLFLNLAYKKYNTVLTQICKKEEDPTWRTVEVDNGIILQSPLSELIEKQEKYFNSLKNKETITNNGVLIPEILDIFTEIKKYL